MLQHHVVLVHHLQLTLNFLLVLQRLQIIEVLGVHLGQSVVPKIVLRVVHKVRVVAQAKRVFLVVILNAQVVVS